jgi:hypothetical protein
LLEHPVLVRWEVNGLEKCFPTPEWVLSHWESVEGLANWSMREGVGSNAKMNHNLLFIVHVCVKRYSMPQKVVAHNIL